MRQFCVIGYHWALTLSQTSCLFTSSCRQCSHQYCERHGNHYQSVCACMLVPCWTLSICACDSSCRVKREQLGPHDWLSMPVPSGQRWLLVQGLEPETAYQFSVLAQNKLGTGPFSEVVTVNTLGWPPARYNLQRQDHLCLTEMHFIVGMGMAGFKNYSSYNPCYNDLFSTFG